MSEVTTTLVGSAIDYTRLGLGPSVVVAAAAVVAAEGSCDSSLLGPCS